MFWFKFGKCLKGKFLFKLSYLQKDLFLSSRKNQMHQEKLIPQKTKQKEIERVEFSL